MKFGEAVKPLCGLLDAMDTDVNVENYPRAMYEAGRHKEDATQQVEEEPPHPVMGQQMNEEGGEGPSRRRVGLDARGAIRGQERQAAEGGYTTKMKGRTTGNIRSRRRRGERARMPRNMGDVMQSIA